MKTNDTSISYPVKPQEVPEFERNKKLIAFYATGAYSYRKLSRIFKISPQRVAELIPNDIKAKVKVVRREAYEI